MKYYRVYLLYKGKQQDFVIKAMNKIEAILDAKHSFPGLIVKVEEISMPFEEKIKIFKEILNSKIFRRRLNYPMYVLALRQLIVLLKASISLKDALEDIGKNTKDSLIKEVFLKSAEAIDNGKSISEVFMKYEQYLGGISLAMVRLGEQTGDLVMALTYLANIYEKMYQNRKKMIKALRYPLMTLFFIMVAFIILMVVVVPKFQSVFNRYHLKLPLPTRILLDIEYVINHYGIFVLMLFVAIIIATFFFYKTSYAFKYKIDKLLLKTYLIKNIIEYSILHKFLLILSSLLKSGIPLLDALKITNNVIWNEVMREKLEKIIIGINKGRNLSEMFEETKIVNYIAVRMIKAGEESGELDNMIENAANYYNEKFEDIVENMQSYIEPIMLIVIGALVLLIALGIFLPMWNLTEISKYAS